MHKYIVKAGHISAATDRVRERALIHYVAEARRSINEGVGSNLEALKRAGQRRQRRDRPG
jgi:hypothetical protein